MSNASDFVVRNGILMEYTGPGGDVVIPEGVTQIWQNVFRQNAAVTGVYLPDGLTEVSQYAFRGCMNLKHIRIPQSLQEIGNGAFAECRSLEEVVLPGEMKRIGIAAFANCAGLKRLVLPGVVRLLGYNLFDGVEQLEVLEIPCKAEDATQIHFIATNMFNLDNLILYYLNSSLVTCEPMKKALFKRLNTKANRGRFFLRWIEQRDAALTAKFLNVIPKISAEELDNYIHASESNPEICALFLDYKNKRYTAADLADAAMEQAEKDMGLRERTVADWKKIYKINSEGHITGYKATDPVAEVPCKVRNSTFEIGNNAFKYCDFLERVTIAEGIHLIGNSAFNGCTKLEEITIPSTLLKIGASAFKNCVALTHVTFPEGITNIGSKAFEGCEHLVIHAKAGSKIIQYAQKNNIPFVAE